MASSSKLQRSLQIMDPRSRRTMCRHSGVELPQPPLDVLRAGERMQFRSAEKLFLVHFFDSRRSWQWLPKSKMAPFGVNKMLDRMKLMEARSSSVRKSVRLAFDRAMNHLDRARELEPNTGLGVTIWSPATSRILPSLNHVFVTAENTVSAVYAQHKHILFTMFFKLEPNQFHPSSHTGSTSLKYCSLKQLFLFVKSYAMKNVFVSGFKKLTGEKKKRNQILAARTEK